MPAPNVERLYLIRSGLNRMARDLRVLRQQVAREIEAAETTNDSPQEDTRHDDRRTARQDH